MTTEANFYLSSIEIDSDGMELDHSYTDNCRPAAATAPGTFAGVVTMNHTYREDTPENRVMFEFPGKSDADMNRRRSL